MVRTTKLWVTASLLALIFMQIPNYGAAMPYNAKNRNLRFSCDPQIDIYTVIPDQICNFDITRIQDTQEEVEKTYSDDAYDNKDQPEEFGCMTKEDDNGVRQYYSKIYKTEAPVSWTNIGPTEYSPFSNDSDSCVKLVHTSQNGNYLGSLHRATVDVDNIHPSTIGLVSFDVMAHMNISTAEYGHESYAKFYFELDDPTDTASTIQLVFETRNETAQADFSLNVYFMKINSTDGTKSIPQHIFKGAVGDFNWLNVEVFFDCYNDVYNITIGQYNPTFSGWVVAPQSSVFRGQQYDPTTFERTNVGYRYAPSHLLNALDFWIDVDEDFNQPNDSYRSTAYVDNIELKTWKFPAIFADVRLENATINAITPEGIRYMNNSIISCYEPPKYPGNSYSISYESSYLLSASNPGFITPWVMAPSWQYYIPLVVTSDHNMNVQSILKVINDIDHPIEERGVVQPTPDSPYVTDKEMGLNEQFFEFVNSESGPYKYHFDARFSDQILIIEYYNSLEGSGILKSIHLYNSSLGEQPMVQLVVTGGFDTEEPFIDGYPMDATGLFMAASIVCILGMVSKKRKKSV